MPVYYGTPEEAAAVAFSRPTHAVMDYIAQSVQNYMGTIGNLPGMVCNRVLEQYNKFKEIETGRVVEALRNKVNNVWQGNTIHTLHGVGGLQQSPDAMIRWIMANPSIRTMYHNDRIEGYGDRYIDRQPDRVGASQYDYRRVMDGAITNKEGVPSYTNYYEKLIPNDVILSSIDRATIRAAWDVAEEAFDSGDGSDPTSEWNGLIR